MAQKGVYKLTGFVHHFSVLSRSAASQHTQQHVQAPQEGRFNKGIQPASLQTSPDTAGGHQSTCRLFVTEITQEVQRDKLRECQARNHIRKKSSPIHGRALQSRACPGCQGSPWHLPCSSEGLRGCCSPGVLLPAAASKAVPLWLSEKAQFLNEKAHFLNWRLGFEEQKMCVTPLGKERQGA